MYKVGQKIRNRRNLYGVVTEYSHGRYDVQYKDGRVDQRLRQSDIRPLPLLGRKKKSTVGSRWTTEEIDTDEEWVDRGGLASVNVVNGKRRCSSSRDNNSISCSNNNSSSKSLTTGTTLEISCSSRCSTRCSKKTK